MVEDALQEWEPNGDEPTSWQLDGKLRRVTFARSRELSVFSETTSAPMSALHAHPAWTLLLPVDGGTVTVISDDAVQVRNNGVLLPPQSQYRSATDGPHVAAYANACGTARPQSMSPQTVGAASVRRLLDALDVDGGTDLCAAMIELAPLVGRSAPIDSRLAFVIEALPDAGRLDLLADEVRLSSSRLRALAHTEIGVSLTQLRLWSRLGRAIA